MENNYSFMLTAKLLGERRNLFIKTLVKRKYIFYDSNGKLQPYDRYLQQKIFVLREYINKNNGYRGWQTLVTEKGRNYFKARIEKDNTFIFK